MVTHAKISPKMVNPRDLAGNVEEEEEEESQWLMISRLTPYLLVNEVVRGGEMGGLDSVV